MRFQVHSVKENWRLQAICYAALCLQNIKRLLCLALFAAVAAQAELYVPAFTAYFDPKSNGGHLSEKNGITGWNDPTLKILWFGEIKTPGALDCSVALKLSAGAATKLRLTVAGQAREVTTRSALAKFGAFKIAASGYQRFMLESLNGPGHPAGDIEALVLDGPASANAHFNLKPRRNTASVHLFYPTPKGEKIAAFYCETTGLEDPVATYYEACGWNRGYLGMQVNSPTERRIIFSVWDSGGEAVDRKKVADENRTKLIAKGEGVVAGDFGNEGTGGHSHLLYPWKTGEKQRFVVVANVVDATHTVYSGFWFHPEQKKWMLISSWNAPKTGDWLHGLYSFSENFGGSNGHLRRKALFGNQWIRTAEGRWIEITTASFSHDGTGKEDRLDRCMGIERGQFFLSSGGFVPGFTKYGEKFTRPGSSMPPVLNLPPLPKG